MKFRQFWAIFEWISTLYEQYCIEVIEQNPLFNDRLNQKISRRLKKIWFFDDNSR